MFYTILFFLTVALSCATIILGVLVIETYSSSGRVLIRQWRISISKRKQINDALVKVKASKRAAVKSSQEKHDALQSLQRVEKKTESRLARMGGFIIAEQCGDHIKGIRANNYHAKEKKILRSIEVAAKNGYHLPEDEREQLARMLKESHELAIRAEKEREKQAEIRSQMREEEKRDREIQRAIKEAERETKLKKAALKEAIRLLGDTHSAEVEKLKVELAEAESKAERTISMAQQTRAGHIYIISNIGSFGEGVYKVGMTRRLEPMDRVKELGDASVPFGFDVHAMISSDDAPSLESLLHKDLESYRVNRVNYRKEFFRANLDIIIDLVRNRHGNVEYKADPEALEYIESMAIYHEEGSVEALIEREAERAEENNDG